MVRFTLAALHQMTIYKRNRVGPSFGLDVLGNEALEDPETNVIRLWKHMLFYRHKISEHKHKIPETAEVRWLRS